MSFNKINIPAQKEINNKDNSDDYFKYESRLLGAKLFELKNKNMSFADKVNNFYMDQISYSLDKHQYEEAELYDKMINDIEQIVKSSKKLIK